MPLEHSKSSPLDDDRMNIMMMIMICPPIININSNNNTTTHVRTVFPVTAFAGKEPTIRECCKGAVWFGGGEAEYYYCGGVVIILRSVLMLMLTGCLYRYADTVDRGGGSRRRIEEEERGRSATFWRSHDLVRTILSLLVRWYKY